MNLLRTAVGEDLRSSLGSEKSHGSIFIRVYANIQGLAKTYYEAGILSGPATFLEFVRGFNMANNQCDFVDAGNGKECADEKIKGTVRFTYFVFGARTIADNMF